MPDQTNITPPRVPFTDPRTGLISREWYRFFLSLFNLTGGGTNTVTLVDLQLGPADQQQDDQRLYALTNQLETLPPVIPTVLPDDSSPLVAVLTDQLAEMQKELDSLKLQVRDELGTMAMVQRDNVDYVRFAPDPSPDPGTDPRIVCWNEDDDTLNIHHTGGVKQQVGEETYMRVINNTGSTIADGSAVRFSGVDGNGFIEIEKLIADGTVNSLYVIGVATQDILDGGLGRVTIYGRVRDIDTTGSPYSETWAVGDILYASPGTSGGLTNVKPTAPDICVPMAAVLTTHATTGQIFVRPTIEQQEWYGAFSDTTDQTLSATYTPTAITYNTTDFTQGFSIASSSRVTASVSGLYNFEFSLQLESGSASSKLVHIWCRLNGTDVANSLSTITISGSGTTLVPAWNFIESLDAGDYFQLMWAADDTNVSISAHAAETGSVGTATFARPAVPSVILTVTQVSQ